MTATPPIFTGIAQVMDDYDYFFLDVWGVLHDGINAYDGVIDTLKTLRANGKTVLLLSNSPCLSPALALPGGKIGKMGLTAELYNHFLTSGDCSHDYMAQHHDGQKVYSFWADEEPTAFEGLNLTRVYDVREADFMYASLLAHNTSMMDYEDALSLALQHKITLVCGNPDRVVGYGDSMHLCVGSLAEWYENNGGHVVWIGKPYPAIYNQAWETIGKPDKSGILAIGDSLITDVAGATNFGCDVLWNVTGIHWEELKMDHAQTQIDPAKIPAALKGHAIPTGLLQGFRL